MLEAEIARRVLDQDLPTKGNLRLIDVPTDYLETLFRVRQREKMIQVDAAREAPGQVLRHKHWLNVLDERREPQQMTGFQIIRTAEGESYAVEGNRILA